MTTIAWSRESGIVAADRQCSYHCTPATKLFTLADRSVVGIAGSLEFCLAAVKYLDGSIGPKPTSSTDNSTLLRVYPDGTAEVYHSQLEPYPVLLPFFAVGSGSDYAMGALAMGATPERAIEIASQFDEATGGGIDVRSPLAPEDP